MQTRAWVDEWLWGWPLATLDMSAPLIILLFAPDADSMASNSLSIDVFGGKQEREVNYCCLWFLSCNGSLGSIISELDFFPMNSCGCSSRFPWLIFTVLFILGWNSLADGIPDHFSSDSRHSFYTKKPSILSIQVSYLLCFWDLETSSQIHCCKQEMFCITQKRCCVFGFPAVLLNVNDFDSTWN